MRYDEMRQHVETHFRTVLQKYKDRISLEGDVSDAAKEALRGSIGFVDDDIWHELALQPDQDGSDLLSRFKTLRGVRDLSTKEDALLLAEYRKGYRSLLEAALNYQTSLDDYEIENQPQTTRAAVIPTDTLPEAVDYRMTVKDYMSEGQRGELWAAKTISEKHDALDLLGVITGNKPTSQLTKADARMVKATVARLPKNRSKDPRTRDLSLADMMLVADVPKLATRTVNAYLSAFQSFAAWAVNNGHMDENIFTGTRLPQKTRDSTKQRAAFDAAQLGLMFGHLTANQANLVRKDDHKWPTLIAMFTGARLNEVAQLHTCDVRQVNGTWCIDINDDDEKTLKTAASRRLVPVHQRLLDTGFLAFVDGRRSGAARLFPSLSYSAQNGYGRNVGRWFNEKFLPALALKQDTLVFHSLRHSMVTLLSQADVPDSMVKALVGHGQVGVTHTSYFKTGFTVEQLKREIDKFTFQITE
ncbi:site-specific integrase [Sulfitobacter sp.]|uniref:site-specific integrase n=1 Tax=Sulfitobacter sp. TaxID=1903071 RepID=UPI0030016C9A